jgi:hypothetical protein
MTFIFVKFRARNTCASSDRAHDLSHAHDDDVLTSEMMVEHA